MCANVSLTEFGNDSDGFWTIIYFSSSLTQWQSSTLPKPVYSSFSWGEISSYFYGLNPRICSDWYLGIPLFTVFMHWNGAHVIMLEIHVSIIVYSMLSLVTNYHQLQMAKLTWKSTYSTYFDILRSSIVINVLISLDGTRCTIISDNFVFWNHKLSNSIKHTSTLKFEDLLDGIVNTFLNAPQLETQNTLSPRIV